MGKRRTSPLLTPTPSTLWLSVALRMSLSGCRRRTPRPQRCSEASSRSWEATTSRLLKSTGPDALTKPNPNSGPILDLTGPSMDQLTKPQPSTLIVTDYPPAHPSHLSPIPPIYLWRQILVTNTPDTNTSTTNISVETNMCHQCNATDIFVETNMRYASAPSTAQ